LKKYPGIKVLQTIDDKGDSRNAYDAIAALVQKKEKIDGIIGLEASGGEGAAEVLNRFDLAGKVKIVAFDKNPETLDWISRGAITATVVQKPYIMGFYGVRFADDLHHNVVHEYKDWRTAPSAPLPVWVDTGTAYPHAGTTADPLTDANIQAEVHNAVTTNGWTEDVNHIVAVFKETASGAKNDRVERKKAMALAQAREIDAILVTELSRWMKHRGPPRANA